MSSYFHQDELLAVVQGLGTLQDTVKKQDVSQTAMPAYDIGEDYAVCTSDLWRALRRDHPTNRDVWKTLAGWKTVTSHLLPLFIQVKKPQLRRTVLKVLTQLTFPLDSSLQTTTTTWQHEVLQAYKEQATSYGGRFVAELMVWISDKVESCSMEDMAAAEELIRIREEAEADSNDDDNDDDDMDEDERTNRAEQEIDAEIEKRLKDLQDVELALTFFRNLLAIPDPERLPQSFKSERQLNLRNEIIGFYERDHVWDLVLTISSQLEESSLPRHHPLRSTVRSLSFVLMELYEAVASHPALPLVVDVVRAGSNKKKSSEDNDDDATLRHENISQESFAAVSRSKFHELCEVNNRNDQRNMRLQASRHSQFGGLFRRLQKGNEGHEFTVTKPPTQWKKFPDTKRMPFRRSQLPQQDVLVPLDTPASVLEILEKNMRLFLKNAFNDLICTIKYGFDSSETTMEDSDKLAFCSLASAALFYHRQVTEKEAGVRNVSSVYAIVDVTVFRHLFKWISQWHDEKSFKSVAKAVSLARELFHLLADMANSQQMLGGRTCSSVSDDLQRVILFEEDYQRAIRSWVDEFRPNRFGRQYAKDVMEIVYVVLKLTEQQSKHNPATFVHRVVKARKKKKKPTKNVPKPSDNTPDQADEERTDTVEQVENDNPVEELGEDLDPGANEGGDEAQAAADSKHDGSLPEQDVDDQKIPEAEDDTRTSLDALPAEPPSQGNESPVDNSQGQEEAITEDVAVTGEDNLVAENVTDNDETASAQEKDTVAGELEPLGSNEGDASDESEDEEEAVTYVEQDRLFEFDRFAVTLCSQTMVSIVCSLLKDWETNADKLNHILMSFIYKMAYEKDMKYVFYTWPVMKDIRNVLERSEELGEKEMSSAGKYIQLFGKSSAREEKKRSSQRLTSTQRQLLKVLRHLARSFLKACHGDPSMYVDALFQHSVRDALHIKNADGAVADEVLAAAEAAARTRPGTIEAFHFEKPVLSKARRSWTSEEDAFIKIGAELFGSYRALGDMLATGLLRDRSTGQAIARVKALNMWTACTRSESLLQRKQVKRIRFLDRQEIIVEAPNTLLSELEQINADFIDDASNDEGGAEPTSPAQKKGAAKALSRTVRDTLKDSFDRIDRAAEIYVRVLQKFSADVLSQLGSAEAALHTQTEAPPPETSPETENASNETGDGQDGADDNNLSETPDIPQHGALDLDEDRLDEMEALVNEDAGQQDVTTDADAEANKDGGLEDLVDDDDAATGFTRSMLDAQLEWLSSICSNVVSAVQRYDQDRDEDSWELPLRTELPQQPVTSLLPAVNVLKSITGISIEGQSSSWELDAYTMTMNFAGLSPVKLLCLPFELKYLMATCRNTGFLDMVWFERVDEADMMNDDEGRTSLTPQKRTRVAAESTSPARGARRQRLDELLADEDEPASEASGEGASDGNDSDASPTPDASRAVTSRKRNTLLDDDDDDIDDDMENSPAPDTSAVRSNRKRTTVLDEDEDEFMESSELQDASKTSALGPKQSTLFDDENEEDASGDTTELEAATKNPSASNEIREKQSAYNNSLFDDE